MKISVCVCVMFAVCSAKAIQIAESLVVDLDVADLALSNNEYVRSWQNDGAVGGVYSNLVAGKGPLYQTSVGGVPAVTFQAYNADSVMTNMTPVPASICGTDTWSFETWVFNPSLTQTEIVFSWTARNKWPGTATGACVEFRYGGDTGNAVEHYGNNVSWSGAAPTVGRWHHVACTRDAEGRERLYLDGQLRTLTTPILMQVRQDGVFSLGSVRDYAQTNTTTGAWSSPFSGSLAKVRIHDGTLSEGDVVANYLEERAAFNVSDAPDVMWNGSLTAAQPWENGPNWSGGSVPNSNSRVAIVNGATATVTTAVGSVGRFFPYHGGLVLSNNASLIALPFEASNVYMGNGSNTLFNLLIKEGNFALQDATNAHNLYLGASRSVVNAVIGGGASPAILDGGRDVQIGVNDGTVARVTIEDGGELYSSNGWIYVGVSGIANAKLTVNGGYVGHRRGGLDLVVGHNNAYSVLEVNGGMVAPSQDIQLTRDGTARCYGAIQLNDGVVQARRIYGQNTTGTNILFLNGGTIINRDSRGDFIFNLDWAYVQSGGARFNILSNSVVTAAQPLLADPDSTGGGLTKAGNGTLILRGANTFTGNIAVQAGLLCLSNEAALPAGYAGTVSVSEGAAVGYAKTGGVAELLPLVATSSAGSLTLFAMNANEAVDFSTFPNLSLAFANTFGTFTYTGTYTPFGGNYKFAPQTTGVTYNQSITGTASVTVNGTPAGVLELTADNSFTGGTTLNGGMLVMGHINALGDPASVTIPDIGIYNGASLCLKASGIPESVVNRIKADSQGYLILGAAYTNFNVDLTGLPGIKIGTDQNNLYYNGAITPEGDEYRTGGGLVSYASGNYGLVLTNLVDDGVTARTLVVDGYGMVRPAGAYNNYSGGTVVSNNGALHLREDSGLGKVPDEYDPDNVYVDKGVFRPGSITFTMNAKRGLTVGPDGMILHPNGSQTFTMLGGLHGSGAITNTDSGSVVLGGTNNTYDGTLTLNTGTINVGNGSNFSWNTNALVNGNDGTFVVYYNGNLDWSTALGSPLGTGGWPYLNFRKTGSGTLTMDVPQFYTRNTTIDNGTLKVAAEGAVPSGFNKGNVYVNNLNYVPISKLDVNGFNIGLNGLYNAGCITDSLATATSVSVGDNNQWGLFNGRVAESLKLVKVGTGVQGLNVGSRLHNVDVNTGVLTLWPGAEANGTVNLTSGTTMNIGTNANELNGLLGEYYDFSNTALRWIPHVSNLVSLARFTEVLEPYAPSTIANSGPVSNVFSFGSSGVLFQNKGDYRIGRWTGKFLAQADGVYGFDTLSDDGSMVWVDGTLVVSNNFSQGYTTVNPKQLFPITLTAGWHDIMVGYYNGTGSYGLTVFMTPPGGTKTELPQTLLRPAPAKVGGLTGGAMASAWFFTANAALVLDSDADASYDGLLTGTNGLMMIEKKGTGAQTLKRVAFQGTADVEEGTLALQGSPMLGGTVQAINGQLAVSNGATLSVRSYTADWPNAGLAGSYYNNPNFSSATFASLSSVTNYFNVRMPDLLTGTYQAGVNFDYDPNSLASHRLSR